MVLPLKCCKQYSVRLQAAVRACQMEVVFSLEVLMDRLRVRLVMFIWLGLCQSTQAPELILGLRSRASLLAEVVKRRAAWSLR